MISENLHIIKEKISRKCAEVKRDFNEVKLIAVSKNVGVNGIEEALENGIFELGESKAQELRDKAKIFENKNIHWHFLGHLQSNKVKYVVENAELIHSVDSLPLASEINKQAEKRNKIQKILLEVKTSGEESKQGISDFSEIFEIAKFCKSAANIELIGLMTMAPFTEDEILIRKSFSDLRNLKDKLNSEGYNLTELSMGMTSDFEIAIEEGSTMIRIGTAIFGERDYSKSWKEQ